MFMKKSFQISGTIVNTQRLTGTQKNMPLIVVEIS
jgi:hypothetical protein